MSDSVANFSVNTFYGQTTLHPLSLVVLTACGGAMLLLPRRAAVVPLLVAACFIAPAQRIVVASLDFDMMRLLMLAGWARILLRGEAAGLRWRSLDVAIVAWTISGTLIMTLLYMNSRVLIYRLGATFDAVGLYFLFRCLVREWKDVQTVALCAAWLSLPVAAAFLLEMRTGRNLFSIFGGVPAVTMMRNGVLRCQGAYAHPILAGSFWAALLPLLIALWFQRGRRRLLAPLSVIGAIVIIIACNSSTPKMAALIAVAAMAFYPLRRWTGWARFGAVAALLLLQLVMNNPVWHLLTRIDLAGGSTGWYRYKLIDDFLRNIGDWWLFGTKSAAAWRDWGSNDITNQYVLEGVTGGLLTLMLFIAVIALAFRAAGRFENLRQAPPGRRIMAWALGASLFVHASIFIGVSYFGQIQIIWYFTLAAIAGLSPASRTVRRLAVACQRSHPTIATERPFPPSPLALPARS